MKATYVRPVDSGPRTPIVAPVLAASALSSSSITLTWSAVASAVSYTVRRQINGIYSPVQTLSGLTYTDTGLSASTLYSYTVSAINVFGEGPQSVPASATTPAASMVGSTKWNPGYYMASDTFDGTGGSQTAADFSLLAGEANVLGWLGLYSWGTVTSTKGVYDFSKQIADFNALQAAAPGKRMAAYIAGQRFHGSQPASQTVTSSWVPAYILSNSIYGAGTNGTQHGYSLASWDGSSGYTETVAALWRPLVMTEYANTIAAFFATSFVTTAGPYSGQTFTFDTHPLFEALPFGYESVLNLTNISTDYSDSAWRTALQSLYATARTAAPHTLTMSGLNFCQSFSNMAGFVSDLSANATGLGGPDVTTISGLSWGQHLFIGDTTTNGGTTWTTGGGTDYRGVNPSPAWAQDPDYAKVSSTQVLFNTAATLRADHLFLARLNNGSGVKGDWVTDVLPTINANPTLLTMTRPTNWPGTTKPLGVNLAGFNYSSGTLPFLNIVKQGGQQSGNYNWCGWLTGTGVASGSTNEQALVNFDTDQYPLKIPQAGLSSTTVYTILSNKSIAPGATTAYPAGVYRLKFTGSGTVVVSGGDVSSTLTVTNSTVGGTGTGNVTLSGAGNITYLTIISSNPANNGDRVRNVSLVQSSLTASFDAGAIFHPSFLSATTPFSSLRFMDWLQTNNEFESHNATGNTIAAGATSCALSSPTQLPNQTGKNVYFNDGTIRSSTVTTSGGVTTLTWSGGLPSAITTNRGNLARSNLYFSSHDNWANRPLPSNAFYCMNGGVPYEIAIALCNTVNANMEVPVPMAAPDSYMTSLFQLMHAGIGAQIGGALSNSCLPELSNEVWNSAFTQFEVAGYFGGGQWPSQPPGGGNATWTGQWHGMRTAVMAELAKGAYGVDFARCIPVLGSQASNLGTVQDRLQTSYWTSPIDGYTGPASSHPIKAVAIAPYFGQFTLSTADTTTMLGVPVPLDDFFATLTSQTGTAANGSHVYSSVPSGGWIGQAKGWWRTYDTYLTANYPALNLIMYEGGQQFGAGTNTWNALLVVANRDARMGAAVTLYLVGWATDIGATSANIIHWFNDCWTEQSNGFCWGLYESIQQNLANVAKYSAALSYIG